MAKFGLDTVNLAEAESARTNIKRLWIHLAEEISATGKPVIVELPSTVSNGETDEPAPEQNGDRVAGYLTNLDLQAVLGVPIFAQNKVNGAIFVATP